MRSKSRACKNCDIYILTDLDLDTTNLAHRRRSQEIRLPAVALDLKCTLGTSYRFDGTMIDIFSAQCKE